MAPVVHCSDNARAGGGVNAIQYSSYITVVHGYIT